MKVFIVIRWSDVRSYGEQVQGVFKRYRDARRHVTETVKSEERALTFKAPNSESRYVAWWEYTDDAENGWSIEQWEVN